MTIGLAMMVKDEAAMLPITLPPLLPLIDSWMIVDTGSTDGTPEIVEEMLGTKEGSLHHREWQNFGANRTELLQLARGSADWLLLLDADMTIEFHPGLSEWLASDPDPDCDAWMVRVEEHWGWYRLPLLVRGGMEWRFEGRTHEALIVNGHKTRSLLGFTVHHRPSHGPEKHERDLALLEGGYVTGDPRATFYTAQALRGLGRVTEAIEAYQARAGMNGWEEESWYSQYQAAKLSDDVAALLASYARRPWRHEPLSAAVAIVRGRGSEDDVLFMET